MALLARDWSVCDLSNRSRFSLLCCWSSLCLNLASLSCCAGSWNSKRRPVNARLNAGGMAKAGVQSEYWLTERDREGSRRMFQTATEITRTNARQLVFPMTLRSTAGGSSLVYLPSSLLLLFSLIPLATKPPRNRPPIRIHNHPLRLSLSFSVTIVSPPAITSKIQ